MDMLEPSADEIRDWGNSVTQFMIDYLGGLRDRPAYRHTSSREIRSGLESKFRSKESILIPCSKFFATRSFHLADRTRIPGCLAMCNRPGRQSVRSRICLL